MMNQKGVWFKAIGVDTAEKNPSTVTYLHVSPHVPLLVRITCKFSYICNTCNFTCITCKEFSATCKNRDSRQISSFSKKNWRNSDKSSSKFSFKMAKFNQKMLKIENFIFYFRKKFDDFLLKFWSLSGAKVCESCRSRQELSNEYLLAKIGVDTAENEPLKVTCKQIYM